MTLTIRYDEYAPEAHTREQLTLIYDVDIYTESPTMGADYLASVLFNLHVQITKGPAYTVTRSTVDDKAFEMLRLLGEHVGRTRRQTMNSTLMRFVLQKFGEKKFINQLIKWELDISEYGRVMQVQLPELLKIMLLISKTSGAMYRYLCMQIDDLTAYKNDDCELLPHIDGDYECLCRKPSRRRDRIGAYGDRCVLPSNR